jgi:hypothetical protein
MSTTVLPARNCERSVRQAGPQAMALGKLSTEPKPGPTFSTTRSAVLPIESTSSAASSSGVGSTMPAGNTTSAWLASRPFPEPGATRPDKT